MTRQQILDSREWKYISSLTPSQRAFVLLNSAKPDIEKKFNVSIEELPYRNLSELSDDDIGIAIQDTIQNIMLIAVLKVKDK